MDNEFHNEQQTLDTDVKESEKQTIAVGNKLHSIENEIKKEMQRKISYELKVAELKRNIGFYTDTTASEKLGVRLAVANRVQSQFEMASECYEKLLSELTENYMEHNYHFHQTEQSDNNKFKEEEIFNTILGSVNDLLTPNDGDLQLQVDNNQEKISQHFKQIDGLLIDMKI